MTEISDKDFIGVQAKSKGGSRSEISMDDTTGGTSPGWPVLHTTAAFEGGWSDASNGQHRLPVNYAEAPWRIGWTDGRVGQPVDEHCEILLTQSAYERSHLTQQRASEVETSRAAAESAERRREHAQTIADRLENDYLIVRDDRNRNSGEFSPVIGWLYVLTALVLFVADLPLSFLAADGLGIRTAVVLEGRRIGIDNLPVLFQNLGALWEPLALAFGIAFLGLFFKLIADFFVTSNITERGVWRWVGATLVIALVVATVLTLNYLGELRAEDKAVMAKLQANQPVSIERLDSLSTRTFTLLAVVLPMVGAFFFSSGAHRLHKAHQYRRLRQEATTARERIELLTDVAIKTRADLAGAEAALAAAKSEPLLSDVWREMYQHGYNRGYNAPESLLHGASVYERCLANIQRWLAIVLQRQNEMRSKHWP